MKSVRNSLYRIYKCQTILHAYSSLLSEEHGQLSFLQPLLSLTGYSLYRAEHPPNYICEMDLTSHKRGQKISSCFIAL